MSILDTFFILFESDASKLDKGLKESESSADKLKGKLEGVDAGAAKVGDTLFSIAKKGAGLLGLGVGVAALVSGIKETAAAYDALDKLATRFRSTADAVDEFRDAGTLMGISEEKSTESLVALDKAVQDTFLGMGRSKKIFEELGIEVTDAAGKIKPTTEVMEELAGKMKGMEKGTQIRIMERLGLDSSMLKLFNADMGDLRKRMASIDEAAGFDLEKAVKRSKEYTKASKSLQLEVNTLHMYIEKLVESFKVAALPFFTDAITTAAKYTRVFVDYLLKHSKFVEGLMVALGGAILYFVVPAAIQGAIAMGAMLLPFLAAGAIIAAVAAVFSLLYDDVMNFMDGNDSMIGQLLEKYPMIGTIVNGLVDVLKGLGGAITWTFQTMFDVLQIAFNLWYRLISAVLEFTGVGSVLTDMASNIKIAFLAMGEAVGDVWDWIVQKATAAIEVFKAAISIIKGIAGAVSGGLGTAKSALGIGGPPADVAQAVEAGQQQLGAAAANPMAAQTSNSIANTKSVAQSTSISTGPVIVQTQATDAEGISKSIGNSMQTQLKQAAANFDDGVMG